MDLGEELFRLSTGPRTGASLGPLRVSKAAQGWSRQGRRAWREVRLEQGPIKWGLEACGQRGCE